MKVLISGYYGFGNLGDEALLAGILAGLTGHRVTVFSQKPGQTRTLHNVGATHRLTGLSALLGCDALISGGGGLLQDKTSTRSLRYYLGVIALAKRLGKRVIVYGQSVGPLSAAGEQAVVKTLAGLPIAVRDGSSQKLLEQLGVPSVLTADAALLLPKPALQLRDDSPVLLIPRGNLPETTHAFVQLARTLAVKGIPVAGLALQENEDGGALGALAQAVPKLKQLRAKTPQAALGHVAESRYVVSARLHGLIFAARAGRPFSGVAYDPKVSAFLAETGRLSHPAPPDPDVLFADIIYRLGRSQADDAQVTAMLARAVSGLVWLQNNLVTNR